MQHTLLPGWQVRSSLMMTAATMGSGKNHIATRMVSGKQIGQDILLRRIACFLRQQVTSPAIGCFQISRRPLDEPVP
jgi:ferric iron reductase protein FhuF